MTLNQRLLELRNELQWTQSQLALALKVPRELISMWESGSRRPNLRQLLDCAKVFDTTVNYLLGDSSERKADIRADILLRGAGKASPEATLEIERWLEFLDSWSTVLGTTDQYRWGQPPKELDRGPDFTDIRSAAKLALQVREYFGLGLYALPDLYAFFDEHSIMVCQAKLGSIGDGRQGISGAFYNHPTLGYSILINSQTTKGRQSFTLAHEFSHAFFHYGAKECIVSREGEDSPREQFADAFAAHFLVPGGGLRCYLKEIHLAQVPDALDAIFLAHFYGVSYALMLNRLCSERMISFAQRMEWQKLSPQSLARQIGVDPEEFKPGSSRELYINKYPSSVLKKVRDLIHDDELFVSEAAGLLNLDPITIQLELLQDPAAATEQELMAANEFAEIYGSYEH